MNKFAEGQTTDIVGQIQNPTIAQLQLNQIEQIPMQTFYRRRNN